MNCYEVAVPVPVSSLLRYASRESLPAGARVLVSVRGRKCVGLVVCEVSCCHEESYELKEVEELLDPAPLLPEELLKFLRWCWEYYLCSPGEVIKTALPPGFFKEVKRRFKLTEKGKEALSRGDLPSWAASLKRPLLLKTLTKRFGKGVVSKLKRFLSAGFVEEVFEGVVVEPPLEVWLELTEEAGESELEKFLKERKRWPKRFLEELFGKKEVQRLVSEGRLRKLKLMRVRQSPFLETARELTPTDEQRAVVEEIKKGLDRGEVHLLHGVTGSGKTLVYAEVAAEVLARGRTVLVLVPEIAITPYVETHFVARFGNSVAVLHSALSPGVRASEWLRVARGEAKVVVGTRSALFAPLRNLGLIVVDEEHEGSYKQAEGSFRYNARDAALVRAKFSNASVVLGSATPSVKSYYFAKKGKYRLLELKKRPSKRSLPEVEVVRLKLPGEVFTKRLVGEMRRVLSEGNQVILFLNRRGFAPLVSCKECGEVLECPNCSLSLTYHKSSEKLLCHHCGFERKAFPVCAKCQGTNWRLLGVGTERVERDLEFLFPGAKVARLDRDVVTSEKRLYELLRDLKKGKIDILVGTQMVAQGHDLPGVALVGILWAEGGLHLPDFRAAERTFQLLVQVSGRAGRGASSGKVILQTRIPEHYAIRTAISHDYAAFFREEIKRREELGFPPFSRLALCVFSSESSEEAERCASRVREFLSSFENVKVMGPVPAPLFKLKGVYRWNILLKSNSHKSLEAPLKALFKRMRDLIPSKVKFTLDRDPEELL